MGTLPFLGSCGLLSVGTGDIYMTACCTPASDGKLICFTAKKFRPGIFLLSLQLLTVQQGKEPGAKSKGRQLSPQGTAVYFKDYTQRY